MSRPDAWGWGLLVVEQRGQQTGHHLAGYLYDDDHLAPLLEVACRHIDRELVRLHGAADPDRVWSWTPGLGDGFVKP